LPRNEHAQIEKERKKEKRKKEKEQEKEKEKISKSRGVADIQTSTAAQTYHNAKKVLKKRQYTSYTDCTHIVNSCRPTRQKPYHCTTRSLLILSTIGVSETTQMWSPAAC